MNNLLCADDIGLFTRSETELKDLITHIDEVSRVFSLLINAGKSKTMVIEKPKRHH